MMKCSICKNKIYSKQKWIEIAGFVHHRECGLDLIKQPKIIKTRNIINDT